MIELKDLDKTFDDIRAADHITGTIRSGMVFGLIGSNGAGKSTLLRMISGVIRPDGGELLVDGKPVYENPEIKSQICFLSTRRTISRMQISEKCAIITQPYIRRLTENSLTL